MKRHRHLWHELLPRGGHDRTTFVVCDRCGAEGRDSVRYLGREATAEFRRQIKRGIKPHFVGNSLIAFLK
jgi:hypothetical protein